MKLEFAVLVTHPEGYVVEPHWHDVPEVVYYLRGSGTTTFGGRQYCYKAGTFAVVPARAAHDQHQKGRTDCFCVGVSGSALDEHGGLWLDPDALLREICLRLKHEVERKKTSYEMVGLGLAYEIAGMVERLVEQQGGTDSRKRLVDRALDLIVRKEGDLTVAQLAHEICVSAGYLRHLFLLYADKSPVKVLLDTRIAKAKSLLEGTNRSMSDIAYACGFQTPQYFAKVFKKIAGMPPRVFRSKGIERLNRPETFHRDSAAA